MKECKESLKVVRYPANDVFNRKLDLPCGDFDGDINSNTISNKLDQLIKETTDKAAEQMLKFGKYVVYCSDRTLMGCGNDFDGELTFDGRIYN